MNRLFHFRRGGQAGDGSYLHGFAVFRIGSLELTVFRAWFRWPAGSRLDWHNRVARLGPFVLSWWEGKHGR
jgi:hypothetical protein